MTSPTVDYNTFITMPQAFEDVGGPWRLSIDTSEGSAPLRASSATVGGVNRMLVTSTGANSSRIDIWPILTANVTLDLGRYSSPSNIRYSWSYIPFFTRVDNPVQTFHLTSSVGVTSWSDNFLTSTYTTGLVEPNPVNRITHNETLVVSGATSGLKYITLQIAIGVTSTTSTFQFMIADAHFQILTAQATSSSSLPPSTSSSVNPTGSITESNIQPASTSLPSGAIAGIVIGTVALLALLIAFFFWRRKQNRQGAAQKLPANNGPQTGEAQWGAQPMAYSVPAGTNPPSPPANALGVYQSHGSPDNSSTRPMLFMQDSANAPFPTTSSDASGQGPDAWRTSYVYNSAWTPGHGHSNSVSTGGPPAMGDSTSISSPRFHPPPVYGGSAALATWARENRAVITEDLEAKLANAGYLPTDNPDLMTPEIWANNYGVSPLELARIKGLYASSAKQ